MSGSNPPLMLGTPATHASALTASDRLQVSRERLRLALRRSAGLDKPAHGQQPLPGWAGSVLALVRSVPGAEAVMEGVRHWWQNHPLRASARVAGEAARGIAEPLAQRQPLAMVFGALLAGALLTRLRPWRWLPRTLMFAGLLPQVAAKLVAAVPFESWLNAFTAHSVAHGARAPRGA